MLEVGTNFIKVEVFTVSWQRKWLKNLALQKEEKKSIAYFLYQYLDATIS